MNNSLQSQNEFVQEKKEYFLNLCLFTKFILISSTILLIFNYIFVDYILVLNNSTEKTFISF